MTTGTSEDRIVTVDTDGHVLEPRDTWLQYIEPNLRKRALRIETDDRGIEVLLVDGRPHMGLYGRLGALGGIGMEAKDLMTAGARSYEDGCPPGGYDPAARLAVMDDEEIDIALLYPTIGIAWEAHIEDPKLATAYARAYNRWLVDFCSHDRKRLVPIAHICLKDPVGAVEEVKRARKDGCVGRLPLAGRSLSARDGKQFDDPELAPVLGDGAGSRHADRLPRGGARCHRRQRLPRPVGQGSTADDRLRRTPSSPSPSSRST